MKALFLLIPSLAVGQPALPKPISFAWDAPTNMANVLAYELQWGSSFVQLPLNITEFSVPNYPLSYSSKVGVKSLGPNGTHSTTNTIYVANYIASHEESEDGANWVVKKQEQITFERKPTSLIRVRLEITKPNNTGE